MNRPANPFYLPEEEPERLYAEADNFAAMILVFVAVALSGALVGALIVGLAWWLS